MNKIPISEQVKQAMHRRSKTGGYENPKKSLSWKLKKKLHLKKGESIVDVAPPELVEKAKKLVRRDAASRGLVGKSTVPMKKQMTALAEHLSGASQREVEAKYDLSNGYLNQLLHRVYPNPEAMEKVMHELFLANAIIMGGRAQEEAPNMSGKDAAIAAGIFSQRAMEIKRHREGKDDAPLSVNVVLQLQQTLENVKKVHGHVIENE